MAGNQTTGYWIHYPASNGADEKWVHSETQEVRYELPEKIQCGCRNGYWLVQGSWCACFDCKGSGVRLPYIEECAPEVKPKRRKLK